MKLRRLIGDSLYDDTGVDTFVEVVVVVEIDAEEIDRCDCCIAGTPDDGGGLLTLSMSQLPGSTTAKEVASDDSGVLGPEDAIDVRQAASSFSSIDPALVKRVYYNMKCSIISDNNFVIVLLIAIAIIIIILMMILILILMMMMMK